MGDTSSFDMPTMKTEDLTAEAAMAAAVKMTGLADYGDLDFVEGLNILMEDLRESSSLTPAGNMVMFQDAVRLLSNRLIFVRDAKAHPEMFDDPIAKPIIITGLPRTGTSKLQRMMSADPGVQRLEVWRILFPSPLPGTEGVQPDPRIGIALQYEQMLATHFPKVMARHAMEAREPDEEWFIMEMTFQSTFSSMKSHAPKHRAYIEKHGQRKPYAYMRKVLQYLQWQDGGARGRPWILKSPAHIGEFEALLETFPDATVVHCHRDPAKSVTSFASLLECNREIYCSHVDAPQLGNDFNAFFGAATENNLVYRARHGESQIVDVYFDDIRDHGIDVIAQVYARAGRELTPEARKAFADYEARRPQSHFGTYDYTMEQFGLSKEKIHQRFAAYIKRFPRVLTE